MNSPSLTPEQLQALLGYAAGRLGTTPEALAGTLHEGGLSALQSQLSPSDSRTLQQLIGDRAGAEAFLASPEVRALLERLKNR